RALPDRLDDGLAGRRFHRRLRLHQPQRQGRLWLRGELYRLNGPKGGLSPAGQRLRASGTVDFLAVAGSAGLDVSCHGFAAGPQRIEEHVEHAGRAGELELASVAFADVETRLSEPADQRSAILLDHALEPRHVLHLRGAKAGGRRGDRPGWG